MLWRVLFTLLLSVPLLGQSTLVSKFNITQFTTKDGLISNACHDVVTDDEGFVWVAMDGGLMRFDGSSFVSYGKQIGLGNQTLIHMRKDDRGSLWMHALSGDILVKPRDSDQVSFFRYNDSVKPIFNRTIGFSKDVFCIGADQSVYLENYGNDQIIYVDTLGNIQPINSSLEEKGFEVIELEDGQVFPLDVTRQKFAYDSIMDSGIQNAKLQNEDNFDSFNETLKIKYGDLLFKVELINKTLETKKMVHRLGKDTFLIQANNIISLFTRERLISSFQSDLILDVYRMIDGSFMIGYKRSGGLRWFKDVNAIIEDQYIQFLGGYSVTSISEEMDNGFWVSTLEGGIFHFSENIVSPLINDGSIRFIDNYGSSYLIVGNLKSIRQFDLKSDKSSILWTAKNEIRGINVLDSLNKLLIAALPAAILDLNDPGTPINLYKLSSALSQNGELFISPSPTGLKQVKYFKHEGVIGMSATYLLKYHLGDSIPYFSTNIEGQIRYLRFNDVEEFVGDMVMATDTGLVMLAKHDLLEYSYKGIDFKDRVSELDIILDNLIITNQSGGFYFLSKAGSLSGHIIGKDFPGNYINETVVIDSSVFICSDKGLTYYTLKHNSLKLKYHLSNADGLSDEEVFDVCRINDTLFVVTANGIDRLNINDLKDRPGRIIIEYINGTYIGNNKEKKEFAVRPNEDVVVSFATPRRVNEVFNLNRYRINGSDWVYNKSNEIRFSSLEPGEYSLEICVQDNNGQWNSCESIEFVQQQVWYRSAEFIILFVVICFWILTYYFRSRIKQQELQRKIDFKIIDLERKALSAQMNPHFIFNVLNSIQNFIYFNDRKSAMRFLSKFAGLVRKSLNASSKSFITLEEDMDLIRLYLELEELRNGNRFSYQINCNCKYNQSSILVPPMLVQPFVENAVFHGMKTVDEEGLIQVDYNVNNDFIEVIVKDNGTGFKESDLEKKDSFGISLTRQRLELINEPGTPSMTINNCGHEGTIVKVYISYRFIERS